MERYYGIRFSSRRAVSNSSIDHQISIQDNTPQIEMAQIGPSIMSMVVPSPQSSNYIITAESSKSKWRRKSTLLLVVIVFVVYGITALSLVLSHFDKAIPYCSSVVNEVNDLLYSDAFNLNTTTSSEYLLPIETQQKLMANPERFVLDEWLFPVYPFGSDINGNIKCECRNFRNIDIITNGWESIWSADELQDYFGITPLDILSAILLHFRMLEKLYWRDTKKIYRLSGSDPPLWNITNDMFGASKLRILRISDTPMSYIGDKISNWKLLEFLQFDENDGFTVLPKTIGQLQKLGFVDISEANTLKEFPEQLCNISSLRGINVDLTGISSFPNCIADLPNLRSLSFSATSLQSIPLRLFTHSTLEEMVAVSSSLSIASIVSDNGFSNFSAFDRTFTFMSSTNYWLSNNPFCDEFYAGHIANDSNFHQFIENTDCCFIPCDASSPFAKLQCYPLDYNDGLCDRACNSPRCHFDGGDCVQICECDAFTELANGECNLACNTTNCLYDGGDCLPSRFDAVLCDQTYENHGCNASWVGDGWCDLNCVGTEECGYDLDDCTAKAMLCNDGETNCYNFYEAFGTVANSQSNDDYISLNELESYWSLLVQLAFVNEENYKNASHMINVGDLNHDSSLNMHETGIALHAELGISVEKATQINCASCVGDEKYWH